MAKTYLWEFGKPTNDDGNYIGGASDKIGFYGTAPVAKQTLSNASVATTAAVSTSPWGFSGSTQADAIVALVNEIRAKLVSVGLLA